MAIEILTKEDLEKFEKRIIVAIQTNTSSGSWPARMKKKKAAQYLDTSITRIDELVSSGKIKPRYDKDPRIHITTPAYFNKEDLDKIRLELI